MPNTPYSALPHFAILIYLHSLLLDEMMLECLRRDGRHFAVPLYSLYFTPREMPATLKLYRCLVQATKPMLPMMSTYYRIHFRARAILMMAFSRRHIYRAALLTMRERPCRALSL